MFKKTIVACLLVSASAIANAQASEYVALSNCELYDSRPYATAPQQAGGVPRAANSTTYVNVRDYCNVPAEADAVKLNVIVFSPTSVDGAPVPMPANRIRILEETLPTSTANASIYWSAGTTQMSYYPTVRLSSPPNEFFSDFKFWVGPTSDVHVKINVEGFYVPASE